MTTASRPLSADGTYRSRSEQSRACGAAPTQAVGPAGIDVPVVLAREFSRELSLALKFRECAGASVAEIEDIVDSTITALLTREYRSEDHLFAALRKGIKMRALRLHHNHALHDRALASAAPVLHADEQARAWRDDPERALLAREDDLIISEFFAELTAQEREVFALHAGGRSWRAIATALVLPESTARRLTRACERKRQRFLTLYMHGRLCGSRSRTIASLLAGESTDAQAYEQALVHLNHCHVCQREHRTTSAQLRASFENRVLALLPIPVLATTPRSWPERAQHTLLRYGHALQRAMPTSGQGRAIETITGTSAGVKATIVLLGLLAVAGAAIDQHADTHRASALHSSRHRAVLLAAPTPSPRTEVAAISANKQASARRAAHASPPRGARTTSLGPGQVVSARPPGPPRNDPHQREPPGYVHLGVPRSQNPPSAPVAAKPYTSTGGGPFTP